MGTYKKVKDVAKIITPKSEKLDNVVLKTMSKIADVVGSTYGAGGSAVLIERQEIGLPPITTKDGVTVFRSLGFRDSTEQCIMECARDAATQTVAKSGDGTTLATLLSEAIIRHLSAYCKAKKTESPQKVTRKLEEIFNNLIEPLLKEWSIECKFGTKKGKKLLNNVAKTSANGDIELANAVIECFDLVGDFGNITLMEISGKSHYECERIEGFPVSIGWEDSCQKFYSKFLNDPGNQRCYMEKPVFIVYHGRLTEIQSAVKLLESIGGAWQETNFNHNVVLAATGFSESVLANLALNFAEPGTINVFPLLAPQNALMNSQLSFLMDLCAITGARLLDPLNSPLDHATLEDLGPGVTAFEANRFKSNIIGHVDEILIGDRVSQLEKQLESSGSQYENIFIQEEIGKLTGGIAKLKVFGASNGELKEKRDRAEDAVCSVKSAMANGALPGGGWALIKLIRHLLQVDDPVVTNVLCKAMLEPVGRLLGNCGLSKDETLKVIDVMEQSIKNEGAPVIYDAQEHKFVNAVEAGILDSVSAITEALRNSISVASLLGTLGGCVVYERDNELEVKESIDANNFLRNASEWRDTNPADSRP